MIGEITKTIDFIIETNFEGGADARTDHQIEVVAPDTYRRVVAGMELMVTRPRTRDGEILDNCWDFTMKSPGESGCVIEFFLELDEVEAACHWLKGLTAVHQQAWQGKKVLQNNLLRVSGRT